jgi:hypothetical protein
MGPDQPSASAQFKNRMNAGIIPKTEIMHASIIPKTE